MENKKTLNKEILTLALFLTVILLTTLASAESWACFSKGQKINFCNPRTNDRTCGSTQCLMCISNFNEQEKCYNQGNFNACNSQSTACSPIGNSGEIDTQAPTMSILNPLKDKIYNKKNILLQILLDERADLSFIDESNNRGKWTRLCQDCKIHERKRSFKDGLNNISFKAEDANDNTALLNILFFIDSKSPKIFKLEPKNGFTSGLFTTEFKEDNPKSLILHYGNPNLGFFAKDINIQTECLLDKGKYSCETSADIHQFDSMIMQFWLEIYDIANNNQTTKRLNLPVDTTPPLINNLNIVIHSSHATFILDIFEKNLDSIEYRDNFALRPAWKTLCSRIDDDNICEKQLTFNSGSHNIDIMVTDKAGNSISRNIDIFI